MFDRVSFVALANATETAQALQNDRRAMERLQCNKIVCKMRKVKVISVLLARDNRDTTLRLQMT